MKSRNLILVVMALVALATSGLVLKGSGLQVATNTWASAGPMAEARDNAAAVLLSSGRILVTGGKDSKGKSGKGALASAEFLDAAGVSSSAPSMLEARSGHSATLLWDGRVLVAGGTGSLGGPLASAEIYNPASNSWSLVGNMLEARSGHSATLLEDGRVLLAGGDGLAGPSSALEAFDPDSGSFSLVGVLSAARSGHASALLAGGRVIIIGGSNAGGVLDSTEIFDPSSGSVSAGPNLSGPRQGHTATNLIGGILVAGGNDGAADLASAEMLLGSQWTATGSMSSARSGHLALRLADNYTVLIAGGSGGSAVELYSEFTGQFASASPTASEHAVAVASNTSAPGVAFVAGGDGSTSVEAYGFATIQTDSSHYKPGETVTITGSGWLPGETVTIVLHETPYIHEDSVLTAVADANGNIVNSEFSPEEHDLEAHFLVAASGQNAQANTYFWDDHVSPTFSIGNPNCASLGVGAVELKVEPVASGNYDDGTFFVTLSVNDTLSGPTFDWSSNFGVDGVIVKGGDNANFYQYSPPQEETEDTGLHAPANDSNNKFFGLSHLSFCYDIVPAVEVIKTGDALSKVGEEVTYNFTINNTGDLPLFLESVTDDLVGELTFTAVANSCGALAVGGSCSFSVSRTVQAGDADPLVNTVTVTYNTESDLSGTSVSHSDSHSTNLFQPAVSIDKSGPSSAVVGQTITYDFTITNNSSDDSPDLILDSVSDTVLGSLTAAASSAGCDTLAPGGSCSFTADWTVAASPDPLVNVVDVLYNPEGFPNEITASDDHSVDVLVASVEIDKTGDELSKVGDAVNYTITVENTGEVALTCDVTDSLLGTLQSGLQLGVAGTATFTPNRTVQAGDPDPLVNTASVSCTADVAPTVSVSDSDDHSTNLFQPSVSVVKSGPSSAMVGETITYDFTITNNGSADSPALLVVSIDDTVLGDLLDNAPAACDSLAQGASCNFTVDFTVPDDDPDPLVNTVTVHYHPAGFPNDITASDDHSLDVLVPSVEITKTGDELSKVGDPVNYTITVENTGGMALTCEVTDSLLGTLESGLQLAAGGSKTYTPDRTVQSGDPDPLVNTASVSCDVDGVSGLSIGPVTASHSTNLFQPAVSIVKSGPSSAVVGQTITYDFTITNNSSSDSPDLVLGSVSDTVLGSLAAAASSAGCDTLASGGSCSFTADWTVAASPDPLVNTVTVHYHPEGFPNDITDSDDHSLDVLVPSVEITKTGDDLSKVGDPVNYTIRVENTGEVALTCDVTDSLLGTLESGLQLGVAGTATYTPNRTVQAGDPDPLVNTASVSCTVDLVPALSVNDSDGHSTNLFQPSVSVVKSGPNFARVGDTITYSFTITNNGSVDSPALLVDTISDTVLGDLLDDAPAACDSLAQAASCNFTVDFTIPDSDPDPLVNTVTVHYHPEGFPNDITDSDDHSVDLIDPSVEITKTGDELSKVGDAVNYTITVTNTSSVDTPDLVCQITDSLLGISKSVTLASGASDVTSTSRTVQSGDPDPLVNTASVDCSVPNSTIRVSDSASHSTNLFQPSVTVAKSGPTSAKIGELITYSFTITNTSSADTPVLNLDTANGVVDTVLGDLSALASSNGCSSLASGGSCSFSVDYTIQVEDPDPLVNTVTVLYHPAGFPNDITASDTHSIDIFREGCTPGYWKTHPEQWPAPYDPSMTLSQVFDMSAFPRYANTRLNDALDFSGGNGVDGAARILLRAAVASLLNAASSEVDFTDFSGNPITVSDVLNSVNAALNSDGSTGQRRKALIELAATLDALNNGVCLFGWDVGHAQPIVARSG